MGNAGNLIILRDGVAFMYDSTRGRLLSVSRETMTFGGRDSATNTQEYARGGLFTSNQAGNRLLKNSTLVGISAQTNGPFNWTVRVRKNGDMMADIASLAVAGVAGAQDTTLNVDFNAGDDIEVFIDGAAVNRPLIKLEFAYR